MIRQKIRRLALFSLMVSTATVVGCDSGNEVSEPDAGNVVADAGTTPSTDAAVDRTSSDGGELSQAERDGLTFVREEEKLARDVYAALEAQDPTFVNIGQSEQVHMDAVGTLLTRYNVADPTSGKAPGEFTNPDLQALYDRLVAQGSASPLAALAVGVEIEELDLHDLEGLTADVQHNDILTVYENLARGSRNHLRTFYGKLVAMGGTYDPKYLDRATFDSIVSSPIERGF